VARERRVTVPYGFETVSTAVSLLLQRSGWEVVKADKEAGHFEVQLRFDPLRFPETFFIEVLRLDDSRTEVFVGGTIRYVILDLGMTGAYLDSFFKRLGEILREGS
jgi:hypothetical protein